MPLATHALATDLSGKSRLGLCYPCAKLMIFKNHEMWTAYLLLFTPKLLPSILTSSRFLCQSFQFPMLAWNYKNFLSYSFPIFGVSIFNFLKSCNVGKVGWTECQCCLGFFPRPAFTLGLKMFFLNILFCNKDFLNFFFLICLKYFLLYFSNAFISFIILFWYLSDITPSENVQTFVNM